MVQTTPTARTITVTLYTADNYEGVFTVYVHPTGSVTQTEAAWYGSGGTDGTPDEHTINALVSSDDLEDIALTGDQWRGLEGFMNTDAFYRAVAAGDEDTIEAMLEQAEAI